MEPCCCCWLGSDPECGVWLFCVWVVPGVLPSSLDLLTARWSDRLRYSSSVSLCVLASPLELDCNNWRWKQRHLEKPLRFGWKVSTLVSRSLRMGPNGGISRRRHGIYYNYALPFHFIFSNPESSQLHTVLFSPVLWGSETTHQGCVFGSPPFCSSPTQIELGKMQKLHSRS